MAYGESHLRLSVFYPSCGIVIPDPASYTCTVGGADIVGTTLTQTLTNKTLTSPTITGITLAGTAVTATGAELNYLDITTLGTGAASKAVVLDAGDDYTWPATGILTYGVLKDSAATTITATGAELNYCDVATLGQVEASKAVTADANKKISLGLVGTGAAASASGLLMGVGTDADPVTTATPDAKFVELRAETTAPTGDNRLAYMAYQIGGAAGGECLRARTVLNAETNTAHGAHVSLEAGATGYVTGSGVGLRQQLYVFDEAVHANGTYFAGQSEIYCLGNSSSLAGVTKHAIHSFQVAGGNAAAQGTIVNCWAVDGVSAADTTKMITSSALTAITGAIGVAGIVNGVRGYFPFVPVASWT